MPESYADEPTADATTTDVEVLERTGAVPDGVSAQLDVSLGADPGMICSVSIDASGLVVRAADDARVEQVPIGSFAEICALDADVERPIVFTVRTPDGGTETIEKTPEMVGHDDLYHGMSLGPTPLAAQGRYRIAATQDGEEWTTTLQIVAPTSPVMRVVQDEPGGALGLVWDNNTGLGAPGSPDPGVHYPFSLAGGGWMPHELVEAFVYRADGQRAEFFADLSTVADADGSWTVTIGLGPSEGCFLVVDRDFRPDQIMWTAPDFCIAGN